ncbi:MAG: presenilin family intramembrane aspartyl protease PSH [Halobacteriales archaeon]
MDTRRRLLAAAGGAALLFLVVQLGALALVGPFADAGYRAVEDPADPTNSLVYLGAVLVMTGFILAVVRLGAERVLRAVVLLMSALLAWYVFSVAVPPVLGPGLGRAVALGLAVLVGAALFVHPEWYVIDAAGVVIGAGGAGLFGISFGPLPALLLLVALAGYDALAVYRTEHMLTLAESVTELKLPLVLVVPLSADYSFRAAEAVGSREGEEPGEREAFFIGLGDTVIPTVLVASAAVFLDAPTVAVAGLAANLPALAALLGTHVGLAGLLAMVARGRAHAGLPLLKGGAIAGYLLGALAAGVPLVEALGLAPYL